MKHNKKRLLTIMIPTLCAAALFTLYCTQFEFDNPADPKNNNSPTCAPNVNCPTDIVNCKLGGDCYPATGSYKVTRENCKNNGGQTVTSCSTTPDCTQGENCPNDIVNCKIGNDCYDKSYNTMRADCANNSGTAVASCATEPPP